MKILTLLTAVLSTLSVQAAVYEPMVLWNKKEVSVCFFQERANLEDTELRNLDRASRKYNIRPGKLSNEKKASIKRFVQASFSTEKTGISFIGFRDCQNPVSADVVVMTKSRLSFQRSVLLKSFGQASIGEAGVITRRGRGFFSKKSGFYGTTGEKAYAYLAEVDKATTIHEFGHIAGLRHEHAREEAYEDSNCSSIRGFTHRGDPLKENLYVTSEVPFSYDTRSVMNYCYINPKRPQINSGALEVMSELDRKTLRLMYN